MEDVAIGLAEGVSSLAGGVEPVPGVGEGSPFLAGSGSPFCGGSPVKPEKTGDTPVLEELSSVCIGVGLIFLTLISCLMKRTEK